MILNKYNIKNNFHYKIFFIFLLGISSGLPLALVFSTLTFWLSEVGVSKSSIGLFALVSFPYAIKFCWAPLIDHFKLPILSKILGHRRSWIFLTQIMLIIFTILMANVKPDSNLFLTAIFAFLISSFSATQDIVIDAYRIEAFDKSDEQATAVATTTFGYRIGMLISTSGALFIADYFGWQISYMVMAVMFLIGIFAVFMSKEPAIERESVKIEKGSSILLSNIKHSVIKPFTEFISRDSSILILLFIIAYKFGDAFVGVMTNPFLYDLGYSKSEVATYVKSFGLFATLSGSFIGAYVINKIGLYKSLWFCGILQIITNLVFILQAYTGHNVGVLALTIGLENFAGGMGTVAFVAYISKLCNKEYTATQYALFSSLAAVGRTFLSSGSGFIVEDFGWINFFLTSCVIALPSLLLLYILGKRGEIEYSNIDDEPEIIESNV